MSSKRILVVITLLLLTGVIVVMPEIMRTEPVVKYYTDSDEFEGVIVPMEQNSTLSFDVKSFEKNGTLYLFMPCRADLRHVVYYSVDHEGNYLEKFETDFTKDTGHILDYTVVAMQSEIPSMNLTMNPEFGSMDEVNYSDLHTDCAYGKMTLEVTDELAKEKGFCDYYYSQENDYGIPEHLQIRGRGNITWGYDKKPYQIKFEKKTDLLGMGKAKKWVLLANANDYSLLRNQIFLDLSQDMDLDYSSQIEPVDLFIDGEYKGSYSLCTKPEVGENRVEIGPNDFLVRFGMQFRAYSFDLDTDYLPEDFRMANIEDIDSEEELERAQPIVEKIVAAIEDTSSDEYLKYIDLESFAKYYLLQEFSKNTDAVIRSVYAYWKDEEEKLYMGPAWDFDRTAGAINQTAFDYDYLEPEGFCVKYEGWYPVLFERKEFVDEVNKVYYERVREAFENTYKSLDEFAEQIQSSADMNFIYWDVLGTKQDNHIEASTFEGQVAYLKEWLQKRTEFMEKEMSVLYEDELEPIK
jgi:hypothetical protein